MTTRAAEAHHHDEPAPNLRAATTPSTHAAPALTARVARAGIVALLVLLGLVAWRGTIWRAIMHAPQYPQGLYAAITPEGVVGDLVEIDILNHYAGVAPLKDFELPELVLWLPGIGAAVALACLAVLWRSRLRWLALAGAWSVPLGVLAFAQVKLYGLGHDLNPDAALNMNPFTPLVLGPTKVANFDVWALPGSGLGALLAVAALATAAVVVCRRTLEGRR